MSILDFIKNRQQQPAPKPTQTPSVTAAQPAVSQAQTTQAMPAADLAKAREIGERLKRASEHVPTGPREEQGGSNAALLQKQNNQDKVQAAMSPTDNFTGKTSLQGRPRGWER